MRRVLAGLLVAAGVAVCAVFLVSGSSSRPTDLGEEDTRLRAGVKQKLFQYAQAQMPTAQYQYPQQKAFQYQQSPNAYQQQPFLQQPVPPQQQTALSQVPPPAAASQQQQAQQSFLQNAGSYYAQAAGGRGPARGYLFCTFVRLACFCVVSCFGTAWLFLHVSSYSHACRLAGYFACTIPRKFSFVVDGYRIEMLSLCLTLL